MQLGEMASITQTLSDEAIGVLADEFDKKVEVVRAAEDETARSRCSRTPQRTWSRAPAGRDDHGPRRPRQDLAAGRDPRDRGRGRGGRRHHAAHRRLPGAPRRQGRDLPRHAGPRGVHRDARPRRQGDRHRGDRGGGRRRRDAADDRGDRPRQGGRRADGDRGQQDRQGGRRPESRPRRAGGAGPDPRGVGRRDDLLRRVGEDQAGPRQPARHDPAASPRSRS